LCLRAIARRLLLLQQCRNPLHDEGHFAAVLRRPLREVLTKLAIQFMGLLFDLVPPLRHVIWRGARLPFGRQLYYVVFVAEGTFCDFAKFRRLAFYGPTEFIASRWARHAV